MQLLREAAPAVRRVAALWHPASGEVQERAAQAAARALDIELAIIEVAQRSDFEGAFATARARSDGIFMLSSPLFGGYPEPLAQLALKARMPAVNQFPDFAEAGGFLAYGPELQELFRRTGSLIGKVGDRGRFAGRTAHPFQAGGQLEDRRSARSGSAGFVPRSR